MVHICMHGPNDSLFPWQHRMIGMVPLFTFVGSYAQKYSNAPTHHIASPPHIADDYFSLCGGSWDELIHYYIDRMQARVSTEPDGNLTFLPTAGYDIVGHVCIDLGTDEDYTPPALPTAPLPGGPLSPMVMYLSDHDVDGMPFLSRTDFLLVPPDNTMEALSQSAGLDTLSLPMKTSSTLPDVTIYTSLRDTPDTATMQPEGHLWYESLRAPAMAPETKAELMACIYHTLALPYAGQHGVCTVIGYKRAEWPASELRHHNF